MSRSLRIAVADDKPEMQEYYRWLLPLLGHAVVAVAGTGRELIEKCRDHHPDLVITDIRMPDMDGIEATARVTLEAPVPVILVSAYHDAGTLARAGAGAGHVLAYLVKPIRREDLVPAIIVALRRFDQLQSLRRGTTSPDSSIG